MIVYGPDGKTPIDPRSLPADAQEDLRRFARFAARSILFKEGPPRQVVPEWARPIRSHIATTPPAPAPAREATQGSMFAIPAREKKGAKRQVRSVAE